MSNARHNLFAYSAASFAVLIAGFTVLIAIKLNPTPPSMDVRVSIANKKVSDSLRKTLERLIIEEPDWHTRVIVKSRFPTSAIRLLKDCDVFNALLLTQKKGLWAAFNRTIFDRRSEAWEGLESRIVIVNGSSGRSWVICYEDLSVLCHFLSENQVHVSSASDVNDVWDVLTALRCYRGTDRKYRQVGTNLWELTMGTNVILILRTDDRRVVTTADLRSESATP